MDTYRRVIQMNPLVLAFVGDAVQQARIKTALARELDASSHVLQRHCIAYLCCEAQACAARALFTQLSEQEQAVYTRARNARVNTVPHHATPADYHAATGIEAVIGFCHLCGDTDRANWIIDQMRAYCDRAKKGSDKTCQK